MHINNKMDKSIVVYLHKRILFGRKMKELLLHVVSVYNMKNTHKNIGAKRQTQKHTYPMVPFIFKYRQNYIDIISKHNIYPYIHNL